MTSNDLFSAYPVPRKRKKVCVLKIIQLVSFLFFYSLNTFSQSVKTITIDFSSTKDTTTIVKNISRNGDTCGGTNCIVFKVILNPGSDQLSLDAAGAGALGSATYQVNCGTTYNLATKACISGLSIAYVTFCKPGGNQYDYTITASSLVKGSADLTLRQNCSGTMSVTGLQASSVTWNSIYPGTVGQYNTYLSPPTSGVTSITVTPQSGSPAYIDYRVSGNTSSCGVTKADTIRVYTTPGLSLPSIGPASICSGASVALTASPSGGNPPYTYSWSTGATTSSITASTIGNYSVTVSDNTTGCASLTSSTNVAQAPTPAAPTASGTTICSGSTATLTATAPGGTYQWYDAASGGNLLFTGASYTTPALSSNTTYYVQTTVSSCPSSRTAVTVNVTALPAAPTASAATICSGSSASLSATAPGGIYQWYDAASGGNLLQTGASYATPVLTANTTYYVQTTVSNCSGNRTTVPVTITALPAAPAAANASICNGSATTLTATAPGGTYQWYDAASGGNLLQTGASYSTPVLTANTNYYVQTTVSGCAGSRTTVSVTVNAVPAAPTATAAAICSGNTALATASSTTGGVAFQWYDAPSAGNLLTTGSNYTTPVLTNNANYYVQSSLSGCNSSRTLVTITVNAAPAAPTASSAFICAGNTTSLTATSPGGTYQWYDAASGGNFLFSGTTFTTPVLNNTTQYYVQSTIAGCSGARASVTANVNPLPAAPTVLGNSICAGNSTSLTATAPGGIYQWYDAASGGNLLFTGSSFITPVLNTSTTYYIQSTVAGCTGPRSAVTVTVIAAPAAPTASGASICAGSATSLSATAPGGTYQWYDAASGGNLLSTGSVYTTATLNSTTVFYVQSTIGSCTGARTGVTVTVTPIPAAPGSSGGSTCPGNSLTLTVTSPGGTYQWYDSTVSGILLTTGSSYSTPALNKTTVYYVQTTLSGCTSARAAVTATVLPIQLPAFNYPSGTLCKSGGNATPVITGGTGTFSSSPAGLVFVSAGTGEINVAASALGTYTVQFTTNGPCVYSSSAKVTITNFPNAAFAYNGPYCPQQSTISPDFSGGASAGVFSTGTSGLVFFSTSTGEVNLQKSTPGTYTVTNTIAASGGCIAASASNTFTILQMPVSAAGPDQSICAGNSVSLNGSISGTATKAVWSGGTGSFTDASQLATQYKPSANESVVKLYLTTDDPSGPCVAAVDSLTLFINPLPAAPAVQNASVCTGSIATLTATSPGGIYEWYNTATGGTSLQTGSTFTSPALTTGVTYYVQSTKDGCTGPRSPAVVKVSDKPLIVSAATGEVCSANAFTYLIVSNQPGTVYTWARSVVTGINNPSSGGLTDSTITEVLNNTTASQVPVTYSIVPASGGCTGDPFFYTATVKPTPTAPLISNSTPVCAGTPLNLFTSAITGASYQWSGPNGFTSTQQNPVLTNVTTASAGLYKLAITVNNCTSPPSVKNIAPVIAAPAAASNSPICELTTLRLTAGGLAGASYSWAGPSGFSSALQNPSLASVKGINAGVYYVTASIAGCTGLTDSVTVTVNIPPATPIVSSNSPVCSSDSITLRALNVSVNTNYQWSGPGGFSSSSPSPLIPVAKKANEGAYNLTVSTPGCAITSASSVTVFVNQKPDITSISNNSPRCEGDTLILNATSVPGASFSWSSSSGYRSVLQRPLLYNIKKANEETYRVVATLNGCNSDTAVTKVSVVTPSVANAGNNSIVCANNASVALSGSITGEDTQAGTWSTDGTGSFFPDKNSLSATYIPDQKDTAKRKVNLTLNTANNKVCPVSSSNITVNITPAPKVNAGPDFYVCSNDSLITLQGDILNATGGIWSTNGSGSFQQSSTSLTRVYTPSRLDIQKGNVSFFLVSTAMVIVWLCMIP